MKKRCAVGAIVINEKKEVLLTHKRLRNGKNGLNVEVDIWDFIKGGIKKIECKEDALKREIYEETGMQITSDFVELKEKLCFEFNSSEKQDLGYDMQETIMYLVFIKSIDKLRCMDGEIDDYKLIPLKEVENVLTNVETTEYWRRLLAKEGENLKI